MDRTFPWKPSAWTFALRWQSKANISNWSSLWAPPSPCPWISTREKETLLAKTKQEPEKSLSSLRNEKRMNLASINKSINQSFKYISGITYIHTAYHMGINARRKTMLFLYSRSLPGFVMKTM